MNILFNLFLILMLLYTVKSFDIFKNHEKPRELYKIVEKDKKVLDWNWISSESRRCLTQYHVPKGATEICYVDGSGCRASRSKLLTTRCIKDDKIYTLDKKVVHQCEEGMINFVAHYTKTISYDFSDEEKLLRSFVDDRDSCIYENGLLVGDCWNDDQCETNQVCDLKSCFCVNK